MQVQGTSLRLLRVRVSVKQAEGHVKFCDDSPFNMQEIVHVRLPRTRITRPTEDVPPPGVEPAHTGTEGRSRCWGRSWCRSADRQPNPREDFLLEQDEIDACALHLRPVIFCLIKLIIILQDVDSEVVRFAELVVGPRP